MRYIAMHCSALLFSTLHRSVMLLRVCIFFLTKTRCEQLGNWNVGRTRLERKDDPALECIIHAYSHALPSCGGARKVVQKADFEDSFEEVDAQHDCKDLNPRVK
jgi:hypothetical protein